MLILLAVALMTEGGARRDGTALGAGELAYACHPKAGGQRWRWGYVEHPALGGAGFFLLFLQRFPRASDFLGKAFRLSLQFWTLNRRALGISRRIYP